MLEPSPPAVNDPEYFADDPAVPGPVASGKLIVTPTTAGDISWDEMARQNPSLVAYTARHWLGRWKRLPVLPEGYVETVSAIGQVAFFAMAPARHTVNGKVGLRYTHGGCGTPFFGDDVQVRIEEDRLVAQKGPSVRTEQMTTVRAASEFFGVPYAPMWGPKWHDPPIPVNPEQLLPIDPAGVVAASDIVGFAFSVLEQLRFDALTSDPSRVQLWPEHFDVAVEIGDEHRGQRAGYGVSPGYAKHGEPFVYVSPWEKSRLKDPYWNADFFEGSILEYSHLLHANDQRGTALEFLRHGLELLRNQ